MATSINTTLKPNPALSFSGLTGLQAPTSPTLPAPTQNSASSSGIAVQGLNNLNLGMNNTTPAVQTSAPASPSQIANQAANPFPTTPTLQPPTVGLLNPHASLASSLSAGPVTSITTNPDGTTTTKHANPQDLASDTITPPTVNPNQNSQTQGLTGPSNGTPLPASETQPTQNTSGTPTASGLLSTVAGFSKPDQGLQNLNDQLNSLEQDYASKTADILNAPTTELNFQQGRLNALQSEYNTAKANLSANYQANLAQRGQNIGAAESALGSATQQTSAPYGTPLFNPATGTVTLGGQPIGANNQFTPDQQMSSLASAVANNTMSYSTAYSQLSSAFGPTVANTFLSKIQAINPQFNVNASEGTASGQQTAAATPGNIQSQQTTQIAGYTSALQQGQNLQSQLKDLITTFGLNPNDINAANSGLQAIAKNTSSPQYQILSNYVNDIANTYAQILTPTGGSQTDTTRSIAASMLDATAKGTSIIATMSALDSAAKAKIAGVSTTGSSSSTSGSSSGASGGWAILGD